MARKAKELTQYSRQVLDFLRTAIQQAPGNLPPTRAEIARHLGMNTSTVQVCLEQLQDFGYIKLLHRTARGIILTEKGIG